MSRQRFEAIIRMEMVESLESRVLNGLGSLFFLERLESFDGFLESGHFLAERKTDEIPAMLRILVESGGGDGSDADFSGEVFAEGDIIGEAERGMVSEDEVGARRLGDGEAEVGKSVTEVVTTLRVISDELREVGFDVVNRNGSGCLERGGGSKSDELMRSADGSDEVGGADRPTDFPAGE